jgi:lipopolysaccharide transport protein LptA
MALSCLKSWPLWLCAAAYAVAAGAPPPPSPAPVPVQSAPRSAVLSGDKPVNVDAASAEVDYRTNTLVYTQVVISQGDMRVAADHAHATGLNFGNSRWTFEGHVRIDAEGGHLRSDQAVVEFKDNHIARATINGKPAEFEQPRANSQTARGHADEIVYDVSDGTVRLSKDTWLSDGQNEISGPLVVYNIRTQQIQAATSPGTDQRVHITIAPQTPKPQP